MASTVLANGAILPPGSVSKIKLSGDSHTLKILSVEQEGGKDENDVFVPSEHKNVILEYPDGYIHHHQAKDTAHLLTQVSNKLKGKYNLNSFTFAQAPIDLVAGAEIKTGDNIHDA